MLSKETQQLLEDESRSGRFAEFEDAASVYPEYRTEALNAVEKLAEGITQLKQAAERLKTENLDPTHPEYPNDCRTVDAVVELVEEDNFDEHRLGVAGFVTSIASSILAAVDPGLGLMANIGLATPPDIIDMWHEANVLAEV